MQKGDLNAYLAQLKEKSQLEKKKRGNAAQKLKAEAQKKRLAREREEKEKKFWEIERQQKQNKLDADVVVNLKKVVDRLLEVNLTPIFTSYDVVL